MFRRMRENIKAVQERDPAARSAVEVFLCSPGVWATTMHIPTHWMYNHHMKFPARIVSQLTRFATGIEIHPGAKIGRRCVIDHGMGVVIGETTEIGDDCTIYQGVTLGGTGKDVGKRHPTIGNRCIISTGAKVLGPFEVGNDVRIGAGSVVLKEIPDGCTVVGIPGNIVKGKVHSTEDMDVIDIPDPILDEFQRLHERIRVLEAQLGVESGVAEKTTLDEMDEPDWFRKPEGPKK